MKLPSKRVLSVFAGALGVALGLTLGTGDAQQKNQLTAKKAAAAKPRKKAAAKARARRQRSTLIRG